MNEQLNKLTNSVWIGLAIGIVIPAILCGFAWYLINHVIYLQRADLLYIGGIAVNAYVMQYFFKYNKENIGRGILAATFLCAFVFFFYKVL
ncbi:stationary phase survival protein SurE [Pedobacter changchengzhani]|uniref:Stationary phase survival protein SurE n=1 Tax=Pedobacter changchengzhani TaxID=2529274 RepID=A0A4R5MI68_9SPHI|nr:stationary phase survival protein SurE [Pedobacter changchengzhani]TDG35280.1 stationary phase survival protein SurE [Pedobacter changchengzhani]